MTPLHAKTILLGRLGHGPIEICHAHGALVDQRVPYDEAVTLAGQALGDLVSEGKAECCEIGSPFCKATYKAWRLAGSVPIEAAVKDSFTTQNDAKPLPAGHISPEAYRASAKKGKR